MLTVLQNNCHIENHKLLYLENSILLDFNQLIMLILFPSCDITIFDIVYRKLQNQVLEANYQPPIIHHTVHIVF